MLMKNKLFQRTRRWFMSCQVLEMLLLQTYVAWKNVLSLIPLCNQAGKVMPQRLLSFMVLLWCNS